MAIAERGWVDWSQQYSREDPSRQHVQIEVHALTPNLRFALLVRINVVRQRLSSRWRSLPRQAQNYLVCNNIVDHNTAFLPFS